MASKLGFFKDFSNYSVKLVIVWYTVCKRNHVTYIEDPTLGAVTGIIGMD